MVDNERDSDNVLYEQRERETPTRQCTHKTDYMKIRSVLLFLLSLWKINIFFASSCLTYFVFFSLLFFRPSLVAAVSPGRWDWCASIPISMMVNRWHSTQKKNNIQQCDTPITTTNVTPTNGANTHKWIWNIPHIHTHGTQHW